MADQLISFDRLSGISAVHHFDEDSGKTYIETRQDAEPILEMNKARMNAHDERARWQDNNNLVASIPLTVYWDLKRRGIVDDPKRFKAWLNDPDNRAFRARPGKV